jgi:flagellin
LKINSNINAYVAANALSKNQRVMDTAMERLSTGVRINSAADDAAGLAITSKMTSQIRGLNQAIRNVNDGIGMIQTADGSMKEAAELLQRMRELAVQSINGTNTAADRAALDTENQALKAEIDRIGATTQWNGINLFSSDNTVSLQVGANANDTLNVNFNTISGATLGVSAVGGGYVTHSSIAPTLVTKSAGSSADSFTSHVVSTGGEFRVTADFNNDGAIDILLASNYSQDFLLYTNDGSGNFTEQLISAEGHVSSKVIQPVDIDGDGDLDVITSSVGSGIIQWHENDGAGNFTSPQMLVDTGIPFQNLATGDMDGDGHMDLIVQNRYYYDYDDSGEGFLHTGELFWFKNDGNRNFSSANLPSYSNPGPAALIAADLSGNGVTNVYATYYEGIAVYAGFNDGNGNFTRGYYTPFRSSGGMGYSYFGSGLTTGDIDGDGDMEIIAADLSKVWAWGTVSPLATGISAHALASGDLDGDGDVDIVSSASGAVVWLENNGNQFRNTSEYFSKKVIDSDIGFSRNIAIADVNGDGGQDIISINNSGGTSWYELDVLSNDVSTLDFGNLGLSLDDRVTLTVAGGSEIQHVVGVGGISQLLTDLAADLAAQSSLYSGATVSNNIITINGLADGSPLAGITVTLESPPPSISAINLLSASSAASGLSLIDESLNSISTYRASFGATLNRLEYSTDNLSNAVQNTSASRSRIEDADYAKESTELARSQIIQQAAMAMLVQANQQPNQVLELLKSI